MLVDAQHHRVVEIGRGDLGIDVRQAVQARHGQLADLEVLDVDVRDILISGAEHAGRPGDIVGRRRLTLLQCAAE